MGWMVNATLRPLYLRKKTQYPLYRRLGGIQGWSGQVRKISPPPVFDPRTIQPLASRYTDYTIPAHNDASSWSKIWPLHNLAIFSIKSQWFTESIVVLDVW